MDLSIVAPVFNERDNLEPLVTELKEVLDGLGLRYEVLLVDDGSRDGSAEEIDRLAREFVAVRGIHFETNAGQTAAFDAGFKAARGEVVVTLDADLQNDPSDIARLLQAMRGVDAAVGYRAKREDSWLRRISSRIANAVRNRISGDDIIDTGCSLKAIRRSCLADIKLWTGMHRFLPTLLRIEGYSVVQVPVRHRPRLRGQSKYGVWNRVFRALADLMAVRWMKRRHLDYRTKDGT
jgi:dolichol-phosphate mannosyltransferase